MNVWLSIDFDYFVREMPDWDWSHGEASFFTGTDIWYIREAQMLASGVDLRAETDPDKHAEPKPLDFFKRLHDLGFNFARTPLYVADSHAFGYPVFSNARATKTQHIVHIDAHHDLGYKVELVAQHLHTEEADCGDWLLMTLLKKRKVRPHIIYPKWKGLYEWEHSWGRMADRSSYARKVLRIARVADPLVWDDAAVAELAGKVNCIFICRSDSWVPPWLDQLFIDFVNSASELTGAVPLNVFQRHEKFDPLKKREYSHAQVLAMSKSFKEAEEKFLNGQSKVAK